MSKIKIQIAVLGQLPPDFDVAELRSWRSKIFDIKPEIESYQLNEDAAGSNWEFADKQFEGRLTRDKECAFMIIFVKVKLENNWYLRRISDNRIVFTFFEMDQVLRFHGLPLKNLALRVLYAAVLIYKRYSDRIPAAVENTNYTHDETRGCLFDMNANKIDVVHSLHRPSVCEYCCAKLRQTQVSNELLNSVQKEIREIQRPLLDRIVGFVKVHTIWSIGLSIVSALIFGVIASLIASWIYDAMRSST